MFDQKSSTENVKLRVSLQTHVETRNGKDYLSVERVVVKMDTEKLHEFNLLKLQEFCNYSL